MLCEQLKKAWSSLPPLTIHDAEVKGVDEVVEVEVGRGSGGAGG